MKGLVFMVLRVLTWMPKLVRH